MRNLVFLSIIFSLFFTSCNGQNDKEVKNNSNKPKTDIKVNKEYDEDGNLIRYDSTYSYYYSNIENNKMLEDSIFNQFESFFNEKYVFPQDMLFNDFFDNDSTLNSGFYRKDYFSNQFRKNIEQMNKMFMEMDSVKNHFFMKQFKEKPKKE